MDGQNDHQIVHMPTARLFWLFLDVHQGNRGPGPTAIYQLGIWYQLDKPMIYPWYQDWCVHYVHLTYLTMCFARIFGTGMFWVVYSCFIIVNIHLDLISEQSRSTTIDWCCRSRSFEPLSGELIDWLRGLLHTSSQLLLGIISKAYWLMTAAEKTWEVSAETLLFLATCKTETSCCHGSMWIFADSRAF